MGVLLYSKGLSRMSLEIGPAAPPQRVLWLQDVSLHSLHSLYHDTNIIFPFSDTLS